jgi:N-carbamoyl-L-amino-acid hydrolase
MRVRADAGVGASAFVVSVHETVLERFPECVATVGQMAFQPGAFNIIPARALLSLEFRSAGLDALDALEHTLLGSAGRIAAQRGLDVTWQWVAGKDPVAMHPQAQAAIARSAEALDIDTVSLTSGAGHDAHPMAHVTPAGMIFVPSVGGISHRADEYTAWEHCVRGANVLLGAAMVMAGHGEA